MIAAAQAAAEAAMREAAARDAQEERKNKPQQQQQLYSNGGVVGVIMQQDLQYQQMYQHQQFRQMQQNPFGDNSSIMMQPPPAHQQPMYMDEYNNMGNNNVIYQDDDLGDGEDEEGGDAQFMMNLLYQQQQQQQQGQQDPHGMMEPDSIYDQYDQYERQERPTEHYMTITKDGTIVEASETILGFPPEALLMTSTYDTLFDEDLPGFLCVKSQFWDQARDLSVQVYIRRRSMEGEWIWLCSQAVQWTEQTGPVAIEGGLLVIVERVVEDMNIAKFLNRAIRITAIVVQAVEAARLSLTSAEDTDASVQQPSFSDNEMSSSLLKRDDSGSLFNETAEMENLLRRLQETGTFFGSGSEEDASNLHQLLEIAIASQQQGGRVMGASGRIMSVDNASGSGSANSADAAAKDKGKQRAKQFDPNAMIESVRRGIRLDLGLTASLQPDEITMLTMVLTGELPVDRVAPIVLQSLQSQTPLYDLLSWHRQEQLQIQQQQQQQLQQQLEMQRIREQSMQQPHSMMRYGNRSRPQQPPQQPQRMFPVGHGGNGDDMSFNSSIPSTFPSADAPPPIAVVNLSYTYIGNVGVEILGQALYAPGVTALRTVDISFCGIDEKGFLALAKALSKRKKRGLDSLQGLILSGNYISARAASELGAALANPTVEDSAKGGGRGRRNRSSGRARKRNRSTGGYDSDSSDDDEDDDFFDGAARSTSTASRESSSRARRVSKGEGSSTSKPKKSACCTPDSGIQVLHLASTSLKAAALGRLLEGLGPHSSLRELNLSSNHFGAVGASVLSRCLEGSSGSGGSNKQQTHVPLPYLDRIDISNNSLGDDGATQLTKIISNRSQVDLIDLRLSSNNITSSGIEKIMNKLLHHNLISLALDKNAIGDQGCQLVAASLQSMKSLGLLNLNFNQIGSRGINSLMRSLIACESVTFLGLSGNILKISGAMALAFTLAQHPRIEELHLDNCCLGQAAQCHITAGIISNRWVPMKRLAGYAVGPPMVAIGALKPYAQSLSNEECFRIRKDEQMKTILQWMESHRGSKGSRNGSGGMDPNVISAIGADSSDQRFLTPESVSCINDVHGIPSQNAYFRMLGWLSGIPFDDDELTVLQKYFYDVDGGDGDRGSDGYINLKLRGDLLAALDSGIADEIRDEMPPLGEAMQGSVGIDMDKILARYPFEADGSEGHITDWNKALNSSDAVEEESKDSCSTIASACTRLDDSATGSAKSRNMQTVTEQNIQTEDAMSDGAAPQYSGTEEEGGTSSGREKRIARAKPRITMFPKFEQQLEQLKAAAAEMIEQEDDPMHHEVILTQYAEASLTILRQLRYHCMNSGLDGWRKAGLKRKVLIVDDSRITRRLVSRAFENANFIVDTASNGAEGVDKMKESIYDIAFMDIDMPVMNGFEATKKLREWEDKVRPGARQPICALTAAYVDDFERSELMKFKEAGLDVMESKPCNMPRLFKVVDDVSPMFSDLSLNVTQRDRPPDIA